MTASTTCEKIREEFSALLDDELSSEKRDHIEAHLAQCSDCLRELHSLKRVDDLYGALPAAAAPEHFEENIHAVLYPKRTLRRPRRATMALAGPLLAAAVLTIVMGLTYLGLGTDDGFQVAVLDTSEGVAPEEASRAIDTGEAATPPAPAAEAVPSDDAILHSALVPGAPASLEKKDRDASVAAESRFRDELATGTPASAAPMAIEEAEADLVKEDAPVEISLQRVNTIVPATPRAATVPERETFLDEAAAPSAPAADARLVAAERAAMKKSESRSAPVPSKPSPSLKAKTGLAPAQVSPVATSRKVQANGRSFVDLRGGVRVQTSYRDEPVTVLARDSKELAALVRTRPEVKTYIDWNRAVIFETGGKWYSLKAPKPADAKN